MKKYLGSFTLLICSILSIYPTEFNDSKYTHKTKAHNKTVETEEVPQKASSNAKNKKQSTVIKSWGKLISLKWNKLSSDDAWNVLSTVAIGIGACAIIKHLSGHPPYAHNINQNMNPNAHTHNIDPTAQQSSQQQVNMARQALHNQLQQPYLMPNFEQYKQIYMQQHQQTLSQIRIQFAGSGNRRSSGLLRALQQADNNFETQIRAQYERECQRVNAMNIERLNMLIQNFPNGL